MPSLAMDSHRSKSRTMYTDEDNSTDLLDWSLPFQGKPLLSGFLAYLLDKTTQYDGVFFIHPNTNQGISDRMGTSSEGIM